MKFEDILEEVGSFGVYQKVLCFIAIPLTTGIIGFTYYTQIFILSVPEFMCLQDFSHSRNYNNTLDSDYLPSGSLFNISHSSKGKWNFSKELACQQLSREKNGSLTTESSLSFDQAQECQNGFIYNYDSLFPTIATENDWVCQESWKPYLIASCFWIGNMVGAWIFGVLSDKFGRRPAVAASLLVYGLAGVGSVFVARHFIWFLLLRFLTGTAHHTISHLSFVLVLEFCGIKSRSVPLYVIMMTYTVASILAPLLALLLWDWKTLLFTTSLPALFLTLCCRWLPESTSWLITQGKFDYATRQLERISRINKIPKTRGEISVAIRLINPTSGEETDSKAPSNPSIWKILKFPKLRLNVLVVLIIWMTACMGYYGHCQNTANIGSNLFMSYLLGAIIEIPAWSAPFFIQKVGRKPTLIVTFVISGIFGLIYAALPSHLEKTIFSFALLARMFITSAYYVSLQYFPEIFPTIVRGRGVALSEFLGGVSIFLSPLVVYLGEFHSTLPMIIFSILSIIGGLLTLVLPETKGRALPQTLSQGELFGQNEHITGFRLVNSREKTEH